MDLSLIQKDILITLITLYHQHSHSIKGEEIAEVLHRNPGTVRNQMQALKALGLVDGVPGPKGGYTPTAMAYRELNLGDYEHQSEVPVVIDGNDIRGIRASEIAFTTLCHPDLCHAAVKIIGSVKLFKVGDAVTIGPTPVNKLLIRGEVYGMDENQQALLISISEMISLPKKPIKYYMSAPLLTLPDTATFRDAVHLFNVHRIHGAPVMRGEKLMGIITLTDLARGLDTGHSLDESVISVMTTDVVVVPSSTRMYEVVGRFKEREIGRLIVAENGRPVGIVTHSDILRVFPSL
ncbi:MAG: CBS domain-containing protein [Methanomicrobiaceae archaeon]|uniref:Putative transcriptional regulator with c-terminal cbs domain n=1 Tax=hydrocarbon metagenome TaxID=938273 RepID=A0A0W8FDC5_9ZZZZ|nr:CBS domain-containing protein [Methanomicrobiaceae archaeon]MDD5418404.1 CBS domain-containing protein [Methanomicrobiaceae archaeon]